MDLRTLFPDVAPVPGFGYVAGIPPGTLGDEASVMMISGLGTKQTRLAEARALTQSNLNASGKPITQAMFQLPNVKALLAANVRIGAYDVPVWVLVLAAMGVVSVAGWYFFLRR